MKIQNGAQSNKRIRLTALGSAMVNIVNSLGAIAKDGKDVLICLSPKAEVQPMVFKTKDGYVNLSLRTLDDTYIDPVNGYEEHAYLQRDYAPLLENIQSGTTYEVDWGDGTTDSGVVDYGYSFKFIEHDYNTTDEHTVTLTLSHPVSKVELNYVTEVVQYGDMPIVNFLPGNTLLERMPEYLPKYIIDCTDMFISSIIYNQDISMWDVEHVVYMYDMFSGATIFNQDLSNWCVPNITEEPSGFATETFQESHRPRWGTCPAKQGDDETPSNEMLFTTTAGTVDYYGVAGDQIIFSDGNIVTLDEDYLGDIALPSGKHKLVLAETRSHGTVGLGGVALVEIHNFPTLGSVNTFNTYPNSTSPNLVKVPTTLPSNITNIAFMFTGATSFNQDISMWDTSNVTDMRAMFRNATAFNQDISSWNTSSVTNMYDMFAYTNTFNQDISNWDVSNVTNMWGMFRGTTSFDQPIGNWDVSSVTTMEDMFSEASAFNQPLNSWNVSNVTNMNGMFRNTIAFNQPLNNWNVSNVTNMNGMFYDAIAFNQDLSNWCVTNITAEPINFTNSNSPLIKPVWGTCPV